MNKHRGWLTTLAQLALAAAWLMNAAVYIVTPTPMARALAMSDGVRQSLGIAMAAAALLLVAGIIVRGRPFLATTGAAVLAAGGVAWSAYDVMRHWTTFEYFHAALAALTFILFAQRNRLSAAAVALVSGQIVRRATTSDLAVLVLLLDHRTWVRVGLTLVGDLFAAGAGNLQICSSGEYRPSFSNHRPLAAGTLRPIRGTGVRRRSRPPLQR